MQKKRYAFTLIETMAAVLILAFVTTSVWVVLERCMFSAADATQRMRAFNIARENMEKLLASDAVEEKSEYGASDQYPDIQWQTTVETFSAPLASSLWARAVCSAEYTDAAGKTRTIELTDWLTNLSKEQTKQLSRRDEQLAEHIVKTEQQAAEYAGVDAATVENWVANGMPRTQEGAYLKPWLDLYAATDGNPTEEDKQSLLDNYPELRGVSAPGGKKTTGPGSAPQSPAEGPGSVPPIPKDMDIPPEILKDIGRE